MKIAIVVTGGLHPSGSEQVVPSWLALFSTLATAHDIHAFVLRHLPARQSYTLKGFHVHDLGRPRAFGFTRAAQARALARAVEAQGPFDVIHGIWGDPAGQLAVRMGRKLGIPSIATFDSGEFESIPSIAYGSQRTARGRAAIAEALTATRTHVCSTFMARRVEAFGAQPAIIPLTSVHEARRHRTRANHEPLTLLQVASLSRVKNQQLLIDALAMLDRSVVSRVDFVGQDTLDGSLQQKARARGVADRVIFHGFQAQDALAAMYDSADAYVQTSLHEAAGVSVLEAAAAGVPIIGTRAGYVANWAGKRAIAIEAANAEHLARALRALHDDPDSGTAMAARAQKWSTANNIASMAAKFDALYRDTANAATR